MHDEAGDLHKQLLDSLYDGVYVLDRDRRITHWNAGAVRITGYEAHEVIGKCCADNMLMHVGGDGGLLCETSCPVAAPLADGQGREGNMYLHHRDGHRVPVRVRVAPLRNEGADIVGAVQVFSDNATDVTMTQRIEELEKLALLDPLTGVGNRRHAEAQLEARLYETERYGWPFGVLFADIDWFKRINDELGHDAGDQVLKMVARTMVNAVRPFDSISRWGGEEFLAVITNVDAGELLALAERLRMLVAQSSLDADAGLVHVTVSIGATLTRADDTLESIVQRADGLMYEGKGAGRNQVCMDPHTYADAVAPSNGDGTGAKES